MKASELLDPEIKELEARKDWRTLVQILNTPIPEDEVIESLIKALHDWETDVVFFAARALGRIGDTRALPALQQVVMSEKEDPDVIEEAKDALRRSESKEGENGLAFRTGMAQVEWN